MEILGLTRLKAKILFLLFNVFVYLIIWFKLLIGSAKYRLYERSVWHALLNREWSFVWPDEHYIEEGAAYVRKHTRALRVLVVLLVAAALIL